MIKKLLISLGRPIYKSVIKLIRFGGLIFKLILNVVAIIKNRLMAKTNEAVEGYNRLQRRIGQIKLKRIEIVKLKNISKIKIKPLNRKIVFVRKFYLIASIVIIIVSLLGYWFYDIILRDLPNVNEIYNPPKLSTKIYDKNGVLLYTFYKDENRSWVELVKIPKVMIEATLAIEDKDFYSHKGVSMTGVFRALWHNVRNSNDDKMRGGSTITQQLVKNVFLSGEKTWKRKISELILAIMVENKLSKNEILERYFNQVAYGGETYGVEAAAERFFSKRIENIDLNEATFLAGLPAAPSSYSPNGNGLNLAYQRQKQVINQMVVANFIDQKMATDLAEDRVRIVEADKGIRAPHFVFYVKNYLSENLGFENIERRGLSIYTSLDYQTQTMAEKIVTDEVAKVARLRIGNGAALVTDPRNGDVLAMVGSKDYWARDIDGKYNVTTALRQPGSSIKPINYLLGLEKGKSLGSIIDDAPITYQIRGQKPYSPQNYNGKFMGRVTLKTALASSLNVPSVKLLNENGVGNMIDLAQEMGITTWSDRSRFGLSLALGAGEVKMVEMAQAYSTFSQLGNRANINPILKINNYLGEMVYQKKAEVIAVTEPKYAYLIDMTLSDDMARSPVFGLNSKLKINGKTVAVKTGTTNSLKDNWCIGWTPEVMVLAWVGNNDGTPMSYVASGISGATPIWNLIMHQMVDDRPDIKWEIPSGIYKSTACGKEDYFTDGREKGIVCPPPPSPTPTPQK